MLYGISAPKDLCYQVNMTQQQPDMKAIHNSAENIKKCLGTCPGLISKNLPPYNFRIQMPPRAKNSTKDKSKNFPDLYLYPQ